MSSKDVRVFVQDHASSRGPRTGVVTAAQEGDPSDEADRLDLVFVAVGDSTRRALLDRLLVRDGQRASELAVGFVMTRQAVGKHLDVLEDAGLVTCVRRQGETLVYLDREPLRRVLSPWFATYARPSAPTRDGVPPRSGTYVPKR